jgi:outer membrane protein
MKTFKMALCGLLLLPLTTVQADILGFTAGVEVWQGGVDASAGNTGSRQALTFDDDTRKAFYAAFEHPLPLLPNIAVRQQSAEYKGNTVLAGAMTLAGTSFLAKSSVTNRLSIDYTDATLYYELLDNSVLSVDMGVTARWLRTQTSIDNAARKATTPVPMLHAKGHLNILSTQTSLFFDGNYGDYSDNTVYDARVGLAYQFVDLPALNFFVKLGVQRSEIDLNNEDSMDLKSVEDGVFCALEFDF